MVLGLRGHRGVGMVRKWKWYSLTTFGGGTTVIPYLGFKGSSDLNPV